MNKIFDCCSLFSPRALPPPEREKLLCRDDYARGNSMHYVQPPSDGTRDRLVRDLIVRLRTASGPRVDLSRSLDDSVYAAGWWDAGIAEAVLAALAAALRDGHSIGRTMREAYDRSYAEAARMTEIAGEFAAEHPLLVGIVCSVVAIGVLYLLWPTLLTALGFGELGPIEGTFAARWQATYGARVPIGSLFAYLQRLGMTAR